MGSDDDNDERTITFSENTLEIDPPDWNLLGDNRLWHNLWYTPGELRRQAPRFHPQDREEPFLSKYRALFRAKCLATDCSLSPHAGHEFLWPVVWEGSHGFHYFDHIPNGDINEEEWTMTFIRRGNATRVSRTTLIHDLAPTWNDYWHIGDVPSTKCIQHYTGIDTRPTAEDRCTEYE